MTHLYANENFPRPVVQELRRLGHEVLTVLETGKAEQSWPDDQVLDFAIAQSYAVLTINRKHFIRLHKQHPDHAGIIICTFDADFVGQAARIHEAIQQNAPLSGKLIRIYRSRRD